MPPISLHVYIQCSFSDMEVSEYIPYKKRESPKLRKKYAVMKGGKQGDGTWGQGSHHIYWTCNCNR